MNNAFEPKILAFLCNWCSYAGADLAGVSRFQYPPTIRVMRTMCSGRVDPAFIVEALRSGFDAVAVFGCHIGDCHYIEGNLYARRKFALLKNLLEHTGIEPGRLHFSWISSAEATKFAEVARDVISTVKEKGPAEHFIKRQAEIS
jgi:F420-non-reducing hydrogenase iron-sulfur subunit